jgi:cytidine deaminase
MQQQQTGFTFEVYDSIDELNDADAELLQLARAATKNAYAPYSHFFVGAVAKMKNGLLVYGTNQENASYPVGLCAERVLLSSASSQFPSVAIETIAISYNHAEGNSNKPISPCGVCRQTLLEYEQRHQHAIRLILAGMEGKVYVISTASLLLPLSFSDKHLTSLP